MATLRNEETEAGKSMWQMVDQAASRAPQWVKKHTSTLAAQRSSTSEHPIGESTDTEAKRSK